MYPRTVSRTYIADIGINYKDARLKGEREGLVSPTGTARTFDWITRRVIGIADLMTRRVIGIT